MPAIDNDSRAILARFPGPVKLYQSHKKELQILALFAIFVLGGVVMIRGNNAHGRFVLVISAVACVLFAVLLILYAPRSITLDRDGFKISRIFYSSRRRWRDVSAFVAADLPPPGQKRFVAYNSLSVGSRRVSKNAMAIAGRNALLPGTFGLTADELVWLMTQWRERALTTSGRK
jgi:hypothetical protein